MARPKKSPLEKLREEQPSFVDEVVGLSVDQLNNRLARLAKDAELNEEAKEDDEDLAKAQAEASELSAPYKDAKKMIRLKSRFIISLIKDKGGDA